MRTGEPHPDRNASRFSAFRRFLGFVGPGFLVSVGYMDPGNWATDLAGGSQYGYALLWVILLSNLMAILFQHLCVRLNVATGLDLAQACRERYSPLVGKFLWVAAQLGIVAMDLAELLGSAIALQILFDIPLFFGAIITALDVLVLLPLARITRRRAGPDHRGLHRRRAPAGQARRRRTREGLYSHDRRADPPRHALRGARHHRRDGHAA